jgi:type II secretory pathway component GspD/PulD (secretin)
MTPMLAALVLLVQDTETIERKLQAAKIDADFKETPLKEVADFIRDLVGINVIFDKDVDSSVAVTLQAKGVSAKTVLNIVCSAHSLGSKVTDGILVITTKEKAQGDVHLEIYEITDIAMPIKNFPGGELTFGEEGVIITPPPLDDPSPDLGDFVVEMVRNFTGSQSWDNDRASIMYQNGLLVVRQTKEVHRKIQKILLQMRSLK